MVVRLLFLSIILMLLSGCISKKEIQLESLSIVTLKEIENGYSKNKYFQYKTLGNCILKFENRRNKLMKVSDTFLKINFTSKEKINLFKDRRSALYIFLKADNEDIESLDFCPLIEKRLEGYAYSYFYPTSYKIKNNYFRPKKEDDYRTFNLKNTQQLKFKIETVGYSRWKANDIIITKDMIDKLEF